MDELQRACRMQGEHTHAFTGPHRFNEAARSEPGAEGPDPIETFSHPYRAPVVIDGHQYTHTSDCEWSAAEPGVEGRWSSEFIQRIRSEHEATHGEAEQCGAECIVLGLDHNECPICAGMCHDEPGTDGLRAEVARLWAALGYEYPNPVLVAFLASTDGGPTDG